MQRLERVPLLTPEPLPEETPYSRPEQSEEIPELPSPLTGDEVLEWARKHRFGEEKALPAGELITQGKKSDFVYVILGSGASVEHRVNNTPYYLATLSPNSVVGEISALAGGLPTASVRLGWPTQVYEILPEDFRKIIDDPTLKERAELLIQKRLLTSADSQQRLVTHLEELEAERMHETPNTELREKLNIQAGIQAALDQNKPVRYDFKISRILGNSLEAEDFTVEYSAVGQGKYNVEVFGGDTSIPLTVSAEGKFAATRQVEMGEKAGAGLYTRILRYLLQGVDHVSAQINEKNTKFFLRIDPRNAIDIPHSELAANSPVVAARKGFISNINSDRQLDSYRVDTTLALILDISTDLERSILQGTDKRLLDIYGTTTEETMDQLVDIVEDYRKSPEYEVLPETARNLCDVQFKRIHGLSEKYLQRN